MPAGRRRNAPASAAGPNARSHIERLLDGVPAHCGFVTVLDGHPATLAWLGSVRGHRLRALGVEHFGQTGALAELYRHYGIDANAIVAAAQTIAPGRPVRHLRGLTHSGTVVNFPSKIVFSVFGLRTHAVNAGGSVAPK